MMTKPRGQPSTCKAGKRPCGSEKLVLSFDPQEYGDSVRIAVDSDWGWKRGTLFHACRAGIPWSTSRGFVGCIRSSASIEFRRSRALRNRGWLSTRNLHKAHIRGDGTNHRRRKRARRLRSGCVPERALERPDIFKFVGCGSKTAIRDKVVRLREVRGTDNEADMGTKDLDGPTHQRLLQKLPLKPTQCRTAPGLDRDSKRRERRGSADEW